MKAWAFLCYWGRARTALQRLRLCLS